MAKYDITHTCGHTVEHQLFGSDRGRGGRIERRAWLATQPCIDCKRAADAAEHAAQNAEAAIVNEAAGLAPLTGSAKQIAWAETIRKEMVAEVIADATRKAERLGNQPTHLAMIDTVHTWLRNQPSASWWIDHRSDPIKVWRIAQVATAELQAA